MSFCIYKKNKLNVGKNITNREAESWRENTQILLSEQELFRGGHCFPAS